MCTGRMITFIAIAFTFNVMGNVLSAVVVDGVALSDLKIINGITVSNGRKGKDRIFLTDQTTMVKADISKVYDNITNFEKKCNNEYNGKREFTDKNRNCSFHNNDLVESKIIKKIKGGFVPEKNESERYLVQRHAYNRVHTYFYDLIIIKRYINPDKQQVVEVVHRAIPDSVTASYIDNYKKFDSAFHVMDGTIKLTNIAPSRTILNYKYLSKTDHWLLNKGLMTGLIYDGLVDGTGHTVSSIKAGAESAL